MEQRSGRSIRRSPQRRVWGAAGLMVALLCGASGASAQCTIEMAKLIAPQGLSLHLDPGQVAIQGDTAVLGAPWAGISGVVFVFERNEGGLERWGQVARIEQAEPPASAHFGAAVAIDGDRLVATAPSALGSEAAYLFERDFGGPNHWGEVARLVPSSISLPGGFGLSVALDGDTVVVGAPDDGASYYGSLFVYERDFGGPGHWGEAAKLTQSDGSLGIGSFGRSVAVEGDTIVAGAYGAYNQGFESGAAYVFERDAGGPGSWGEVQKLTASDIAEDDSFGTCVALSGDTLVVSSESAGGSVYVFERTATWAERLKLTTAGIGSALALDGDTLLARGGAQPGAVYAFRRDLGGMDSWGLLGEYVASDGYPGNGFGETVAIDNGTLVFGARGDDHGVLTSASAYIFAPTPLVCPETYCTPGTTSSGCQALLSTRGLPRISSTTGFELVARGVQGQQFGLFFYGVSGRASIAWGAPSSGCTSTLCVANPLVRCAVRSSGGALNQCDGTFTYDLTAQWTSLPAQTPLLGTTVQAQLWFRDPNNPCTGPASVATTALSNAIEFVVGL